MQIGSTRCPFPCRAVGPLYIGTDLALGRFVTGIVHAN